MYQEILNASGDLIYIVSSDPESVQDVNVINKIGVKDNEVVKVSFDGVAPVSISSSEAVSVQVISADASASGYNYTNFLQNIENNSNLIVIGMLFIFAFKVVFDEIRGWR